MGAPQIFYDRVEVYLDGVQYLPTGLIQGFRAGMRAASKLIDSMNPNGIKVGVIYGNTDIHVNWDEVLPDESQYINFYTLLKGNPNAVITVVPISIATGVQDAPNFAITGIVVTDAEVDVAGAGAEAKRRISFLATTCGGLNV